MKDFAVTSKSFALYEAFKKEAESRGWVYNSQFSDFDMDLGNCLYFSTGWDELPSTTAAFSFTTWHTRIPLETDWIKAIDLLDQIPEVKTTTKQTHVTLQEIADWKGVSINQITIGI